MISTDNVDEKDLVSRFEAAPPSLKFGKRLTERRRLLLPLLETQATRWLAATLERAAAYTPRHMHAREDGHIQRVIAKCIFD